MFKKKLRLEEVGPRTFGLLEDLVYEGRDQTFTIPAGFVTDFASVPQFMTWLLPTYGAYTKAAIVHDYLCVMLEKEWHCEFNEQRTFVRAPANPVDADGVFRRIMRELEVPFVRRWLMWCGVRWGALFSPYRRSGWLSQMPRTILISILALPILIVPTVFVALGLLIDKVIEAL